MNKVKFTKWVTLANGEVFYSLPVPNEKEIDGVKFIEVTPDFNRVLYVKADSVKKVGYITKNM